MDKSQIIDHIMSTPHNINWNVLSTMLGSGDWSKLKAYVEQTPRNMNRKVLEVFLGSGGGDTGFSYNGTFALNWEDQGEQYSSANSSLASIDFTKIDETKTYKVKLEFATGVVGECETTFTVNDRGVLASVDEAFADSFEDEGSSIEFTNDATKLWLASKKYADVTEQKYGSSVTVTVSEV